MQGISVINDPNGKPKTLIIDVEEHDNQLDPFVRGLLALLQQQAEETKRVEWLSTAHTTLNRAYSDDEPDYSNAPAYTTRNRS